MTSRPFGVGFLSGWTVSAKEPEQGNATDIPVEDGIWSDFDRFGISRFEDGFRARFPGLGEFEISFRNKRVTVSDIAPGTTRADLDHILFDHLAPRILAETGILVLHGSTVEIEGRLAVFLGETGAGKSTLAASLHEAGHTLQGDDAVVIQSIPHHGYTGQSIYPTLRLFPETVSAVLGDGVDTAPMAHYSPKRRVLLDTFGETDSRAVPIGAIFFLNRTAITGPADARSLSPGEACMAIVEQSFALDPADARKAARRLSDASALAAKVSAYRLTYARDFTRIAELHEVIFAALDRDAAPRSSGSRAMVG